MPTTQGILGGARNSKTFAAKSPKKRELINEALDILAAFGIPMTGTARALERRAEAFLAVADVKTSQGWAKAKSISDGRSLKTRDIIEFINRHFDENISRGSYDDIRRRDLLLPVAAKIVVSTAPGSARNVPTRGYALGAEHCPLIRKYGKTGWRTEIEKFAAKRGRLADALNPARNLERHEVVISADRKLDLGPGEHNLLQKKIVEEMLPRFGFGAKVLYVGDAENKLLYLDQTGLDALNFFELNHGELPDIVAYSPGKAWLFLIEAVHSYGPISPLRLKRLKELTQQCPCDAVFVTAFLTRGDFRKFVHEIAWETEVWIAENPDHLIHFNGEKFLGPYPREKPVS